MFRPGRWFGHPCRYALVVAAIAFGFGNGSAFGGPIFNPSTPSGTAGGTVSIEVDDTLPDALTGVTLDISDSLNDLTLNSVVADSLLSGGSVVFNNVQSFPNLSVSFLCTPSCSSGTGAGALFTMTFDISPTATAGTTILSIVTDPSAVGLYFPPFFAEYQVDASVPVQITSGTSLSIPEPPTTAIFLLGTAMMLGLRSRRFRDGRSAWLV